MATVTIREDNVRPKLWLQLTLPVAIASATLFGCTNGETSETAKSQEPQSAITSTEKAETGEALEGWPQNLTEVRTFGTVGDSELRCVHFAVALRDPETYNKSFGQERLVLWADGKSGLIYAEINLRRGELSSIDLAYNGHFRRITAKGGRVPLEFHPKEQAIEHPIKAPAMGGYDFQEEVRLGLAKSVDDALLQRMWLGQISDEILLMYREGDGENSGIFVVKMTPDGNLSTQKLSSDFEMIPIREQYDSALLAYEQWIKDQ